MISCDIVILSRSPTLTKPSEHNEKLEERCSDVEMEGVKAWTFHTSVRKVQ